MAESIDQEAKLQRAREAEHLLQHPMVVEAFEGLARHYTQQWRQSPRADREAREWAFARITALDEIWAALTEHLRTGKIVGAELRREEYQRRLAAGDHPDGSPRW